MTQRTENEVAKATELIKLEEEVISIMEMEIFAQRFVIMIGRMILWIGLSTK